MSNDYYNRALNPQPTQRVGSTDLKNEFQSVEAGFTEVQAAIESTIRPATAEAVGPLPNAISRASKVLSFDASGNPVTTISGDDVAAAATGAAVATAQAAIATAQAVIATTKAAEAAASAAAASALTFQQISTNTTAVSGVHYLITASLALTLPATGKVGFTNLSGTTTATVDPGAGKIRGVSGVMTLDSNSASAVIEHSGATQGWI